jgi:hypothetical protein
MIYIACLEFVGFVSSKIDSSESEKSLIHKGLNIDWSHPSQRLPDFLNDLVLRILV